MTSNTKMKAVQLQKYNPDFIMSLKSLQLVDLEIPIPNSNQVLVKVEASTCNPSDLYFMQGTYSIKKHIPIVPGFEGTGLVVSTGMSENAQKLIGKHVSFVCLSDFDGPWAEYVVVDIEMCILHLMSLPTEQAAGMIINPFTAFGLINEAKKNGSQAIIVSAAMSQLAGMIRVLANNEGMKVINIVRSDEQIAKLKAEGNEMVLNSKDESFEYDLQQFAFKINATTALDAVSGPLTGSLLNAMPAKSQCVVYGTLSGEYISNLNPRSIMGGDKILKAFLIFKWFSEIDISEKEKTIFQVQQMIANGQFVSKVQMSVQLENINKGLMQYFFHQSKGKLIIRP